MKILKRMWYIGVPTAALDAAPFVQHHADMLLDIAVASSPQSLTETRDELNRILLEARQLMNDYDQKSRGFHRSAMYKGRMLAFEDFINLLVREVKLYEERINANKHNDGRDIKPGIFDKYA